jgi:hypothetical protein
MSAFSNWNGPGDCGGGASLPQIQTLEQLIAQVTTLQNTLTNLGNAYSTHITETTSAHSIPAQITAGIAAAQLDIARLDALLAGIGPTVTSYVAGQISGATSPLAASITALQQALNGIGISASSIKAYVDNADNMLRASINLNSSSITSLQNDLTAFQASLQNDSLTLRVAIDTIKDINVGRVRLRELADFNKWFLRAAPLRPVASTPNGNVVAILGYLSQDYFGPPPTDSDPVAPNAHKSAIAFVKYNNSRPWNVIVEMSAIFDPDPTVQEYTGSLTVLSAKTEGRKAYPTVLPAGWTEPLPPLRFGLYYGTNETGSQKRIYLGVISSDTYGITYDPGSNTGTLQHFVAGINFHPLDNGSEPQGGVTEIVSVDVHSDSSFSVTNLNAKTIQANIYQDGAGKSIWEEGSGPEGPYLTLGDKSVHLELESKDRPTVQHGDGSRHDIAYLSDIANSIYWQQAVTVSAETLSLLNAERVTIVIATGEVVTWQPNPTATFSNVPGFYTSDKTGDAPSGHVFTTSDVALIRKSDLPTESWADGKFNGEFDIATTYSIDRLVNIERDAIKVHNGALPMPTLADGTTFIDDTNAYFSITYYNDLVTPPQFRADSIAPSQLYPYIIPAYARFNGSIWTVVAADAIHVPTTFDGYVHDITYEWAGYHIQLSGWYVQSYIMWTAHHQNKTSMNYTIDDWAYIDLQMEGYRTSDRQDAIDKELVMLGAAQADYSEVRSTIPFQLPEQLVPTDIPNPAYIHHRPWTGVAILESGTFLEPLYYHDWMVDGGDFTGMASAIDPGVIPWVPSDRQFRNAIIRIWHGNYANTPELGKPPTEFEWPNFEFTWRWLDDKHWHQFSNGTALWYTLPLQAYPETSFVQTYTWDTPSADQLNVELELFDWSDSDPNNWGAATFTYSLYSDKATIQGVDYWTLQFTPYSQGFRISSPRLNVDEANIAALQTASSGQATAISNLQTDMTAAQGAISTAQGDISTLQTDLGLVKTDQVTDETDIANLKTDVAALTVQVPAPPAADGTYQLSVTIVSGAATYTWA